MDEYKLIWKTKVTYEQILTWEELISGQFVAFKGVYAPDEIIKISNQLKIWTSTTFK